MIDTEELLFVVDEHNIPIKPRTRNETHLENYWHRTAHIWIVNNDKKILCQQRSLLKDKNPGFWEPFFGGHLSPGESYTEGATKELYEELGIQAAPNALLKFDTIKSEKSHEFQCIFLYIISNESFVLEEEEVSQVKWLRCSELRDIIHDSKAGWVLPRYSISFLSWLDMQVK